jgi:nicotinate-nucleotide adenylyltransferase
VTLRRLHGAGLAASQIFFIAGADAFAEIATWRDYPHVLEAAHFVVISRGGRTASSMRTTLPDLASRMLVVPASGGAGGRGPRNRRCS